MNLRIPGLLAAMLGLAGLVLTLPASASELTGLIEPKLRMPASADGVVRVALTLDACGGGTDMRILNTLVEQRVPATIFVTGKWLKRNPIALRILKQNQDLFQVENHGAMHVPAVDRPGRVYSIKTAGSPEAVRAEVEGGEKAIMAAGLPKPVWFRGATAEYTQSSMKQIEGMGYRIAGFSLNGDKGATLLAPLVQSTFRNAKDGDIIIAHINQPTHAAGQGVAAGIQELKLRGVVFVKLDGRPVRPTKAQATPAKQSTKAAAEPPAEAAPHDVAKVPVIKPAEPETAPMIDSSRFGDALPDLRR